MGLLRTMMAANAIAPVTSYYDTVIADTPLGYWRLGETTGSVAADSSGNGYNGTYVSCTQGAASLVNNSGGDLAVSGNGTSSQITVGAISSLYNLSRSFTLEAWIKPSSTSGIYGIWSAGYLGFCMRQNAAGIELLSDYSVSLGTINCSFVTGTRYHIVLAVDASGNFTLYLNGVSFATGSIAAYTYSGSYVRIGADGSNATTVDNFFGGSIDEVAVYNYVLNASRVAAHYSAGA